MIVVGSFSQAKWCALGALLALIGWLLPLSAAAHAEFMHAVPAAGDAVAVAPDRLRLTFTEMIEPGLSSVTLLSPDGRDLPLGAVVTDPDDARVVTIALRDPDELDSGTYTVVWSAYSAEDDHTSSGSYTFSIGTGGAPVQAGNPEADVASAVIVGKWLELFGVVLMTGLGVFAATTRSRASMRNEGRFGAFGVLASIGLLGALISFRAKEAAIGGEGFFGPWEGETVSDLLGSTYGKAWTVRVVALLVVLGLASWGSRWRGLERPLAFAVLGGIGILSIAVSGHASGVDPAWAATVTDGLHMTGAGVWLGGLLGLLLIVDPPVRSDGYRELLRSQGNRFAVAIVLIVGAGVVSAWWQVGGRRGLTGSAYGQTLLIKLAIVACILGLAFYNRKVLQHDRERLNLVPVAIGVELVLAVVVLLFSADLSQTPPANRPLPVGIAARAIELDGTAVGDASTVQLSGVLTGDPSDWVMVGVAPVTDLQRVIVRTRLTDAASGMEIGDRFDAEPVVGESGQYQFPSGRLGVAGEWTLEISVRRAGAEDEIVEIPVDTSALAGRGTTYVSDSWSGFRPTTHTALALGLAVTMLLVGLGGLRRVTGFEPLASGFLLAASLLIAGGFLVSAARSVVPMTPDHALPNPISPDPDTLAYAGELYRLNCLACHGADGTGVGSSNLAHSHGDVVDLTRSKTVEQTDGDLRYWIASGVPGSEMPAFSPALTGDDEWKLVLYLRALQETASAAEEADA